jgi:PKHD-type hydroxylase
MYFTECHHLEYHPGQYYHWHEDTVASQVLAFDDPTFPSAVSLPDEYTRKLSFILQLSNPEDYTGGVVQILNDSQRKMITVPRERGTLCIFDSRIRHRVKQVKTGVRYVLVGWAVGPRWK